jgi:hypothetical protein
MRNFQLSPSALAAQMLAARRAPAQVAMPLYLHAREERELLAPPAAVRSELTLDESRITIGDDADDDGFY